MLERKILQVAMTMAAALVITGCGTTTRMASFGPLPGGTSLVMLVVSEDLKVVKKECAGVVAHGQVMGCMISRPVNGDGILPVRAMKIVRYAEVAPSPVTFEIDAHELCQAVASLQLLPKDPCHERNGGSLQVRGGAGSAAVR
jgi:hypothetical protein